MVAGYYAKRAGGLGKTSEPRAEGVQLRDHVGGTCQICFFLGGSRCHGIAKGRLAMTGRHLMSSDERTQLLFLFDTNVLIPAEPTGQDFIESRTKIVTDLSRLIAQAAGQIAVHPQVFRDIGRDNDPKRRKIRSTLLRRYAQVPSVPLPAELLQELGTVHEDSHDWVDFHLLGSLLGNDADFLVTEDVRLRRRGERLGVGERVLSVSDALGMMWALCDRRPSTPPSVIHGCVSDFDQADALVLRATDGQCNASPADLHARAMAAVAPDGALCALCTFTDETPGTCQLYGKLLSLDNWLIGEGRWEHAYDELLLGALLAFATANAYEWVVTPENQCEPRIVEFLADFGFQSAAGFLTKPLAPSGDQRSLAPLAFHKRYGPQNVKVEGAAIHLVPIWPAYHARLFPEAEPQLALMSGHEVIGNGIRKTYLCNSRTSRVKAGDLVLFYRTVSQTVAAVGVVETAERHDSLPAALRALGARTVYSSEEVRQRLARGSVLVVGFRYAGLLRKPIALRELVSSGALSGPPRSIVTVPTAAREWTESMLSEGTFRSWTGGLPQC